MEKAILKSLIYADIFDYPLKVNEIHKWLIGRRVTLRQVENTLRKLRVKGKVERVKDYYFFPGRKVIVRKRQQKEKQSKKFLWKAKIISQFLKIIPWIKLVGISGGLAMKNAGKKDDIDLFIITGKNRLWISRLFALGLLSLIGQRRRVGEKGKKIAGKLCINILLEEDRLEQKNKDIFVAHEVLQMKVLWQRESIYSKFLEDNNWAFKFLPNWISSSPDLSSPPLLSSPLFSLSSPRRRGSNKQIEAVKWIPARFAARRAKAGMTLENLAKWLQLKIMKKPTGMERIETGALFFHPEDCRLKVLKEYTSRIKSL